MSPIIQPIVRRAILDLINDIGGEHNHETLALLLNEMGHRVARRDVRAQLEWLATQGLVRTEPFEHYLAAEILSDGRDVAEGLIVVEGISRHKTGQ